jgi:hypothetical protein
MGQREDATIAIRPCRLEECGAVVGAPGTRRRHLSPTDTLEPWRGRPITAAMTAEALCRADHFC